MEKEKQAALKQIYKFFGKKSVYFSEETAKKELLVSPGVFTGEIYDTEGRKRCENNELISDEMLLEHFDWFVEGVEIYEE